MQKINGNDKHTKNHNKVYYSEELMYKNIDWWKKVFCGTEEFIIPLTEQISEQLL